MFDSMCHFYISKIHRSELSWSIASMFNPLPVAVLLAARYLCTECYRHYYRQRRCSAVTPTALCWRRHNVHK